MCRSGRTYGWGKGVVGDFEDSLNYPSGSDVICYYPRELRDIDIVHRFLMKSTQLGISIDNP